jgi:ribosomal protein S18 acetylase RimI-like enzyme
MLMRWMNGPETVLVRAATAGDRDWIARQLERSWGSTTVVTRGRAVDASELPALLAVQGDEIVGLATYELSGAECELVSLDALRGEQGIGSALLAGAAEEAGRRGCRRLWLITTNDNLTAIRFYQRRGMRLVAVYPGAVDDARRMKPTIPLIGEHGIPIRDELEFELELGQPSNEE